MGGCVQIDCSFETSCNLLCKKRLRYTLTELCFSRVDGRGGSDYWRKEHLNRPFRYSRYGTDTSL